MKLTTKHDHLAPPIEFDDVSSFCALIAPQMGRCKHMEITFGMEPPYPPSHEVHPGNQSLNLIIHHFQSVAAYLLRSIEVTCCPDVYLRVPSNTALRIFSGGAPLLESFEIYDLGLHFCIPPLGSVQSIQLILPNSWAEVMSTCQQFCDMLSSVRLYFPAGILHRQSRCHRSRHTLYTADLTCIRTAGSEKTLTLTRNSAVSSTQLPRHRWSCWRWCRLSRGISRTGVFLTRNFRVCGGSSWDKWTHRNC